MHSQYDPDNIEQAVLDMQEQRELENDHQEAKCESRIASEVAVLAERPGQSPEPLLLENRLVWDARVIVKEGILWLAHERHTEINEDDEPSYLTTYLPVIDQARAMQLYQQARVARRTFAKDPLLWRYEKFIDFDINAPIATPTGFTPENGGLTLVHRFYRGDVLYRRDTTWIVAFFESKESAPTYHYVELSERAIDEQMYSLDFAVHSAIEQDLTLCQARRAEAELRKLLGLENSGGIDW